MAKIIKNKNTLKEKLINEFLDKYFSNQRENEKIETETIEIKREKLEKLISVGETAEKLLDKIEKRGYLFHGSKSGNIKEFEPRKSVDLNKRPENLHEAIYTTNIPAIAIFHAIMGERKGCVTGWRIDKNNDKVSIKFEASQIAIDNFEDGYIYFFKKQEFEHLGGMQFISKEKRIPSHKIPVKKEDFKHEIKIIENKYPQPLV